jgi:hypothetical protein
MDGELKVVSNTQFSNVRVELPPTAATSARCFFIGLLQGLS